LQQQQQQQQLQLQQLQKIDEYAMQQRQPQQKTRTILNPNSMQNKPSDKDGMH